MRKLRVNRGKKLTVQAEGRTYARIPIRTHVITATDDICEVAKRYAAPLLRPCDMLVVSEKVVAITQQRAYPIAQITPSWLARVLYRFVHKSPHGIGLGSPHTMELAIREVGALRILAAAVVAGIAKLFGIRGVFYRICGASVAAIDGPCHYTLPPYDHYAILAPAKPDEAAQLLSESTGVPVAIIDANDLGAEVLGASEGFPELESLKEIIADNFLGQSCEQTPMGIIRSARPMTVCGGSAALQRAGRVRKP